jgi:hypothetical protein
MNAVLEKIVSSQQVSDGNTTLPLRHPDFPTLPVAVDRAEGQFLQNIVRDLQPQRTLEIGCAYGISTLYICEAVAALPAFAQHIVIDPFQRTQWRGLGLQHVDDSGYGHLVDFREERSELVLPQLVRSGVSIDFAFVDGWHTFDQVLVEFYYLNRLVRVGGAHRVRRCGSAVGQPGHPSRADVFRLSRLRHLADRNAASLRPRTRTPGAGRHPRGIEDRAP